MHQINEIIQICQSVLKGNQSMDESVIREIHELALEIKEDKSEGVVEMNEKVHIVSIINPVQGINNKVFKSLDEALSCYEYYNNLPQDDYATCKTVVYLQENVEINKEVTV